MGLDQYLSARRHITRYLNPEDEPRARAIDSQFPELAEIFKPNDGETLVTSVTIEVGYWRKANAIHNWMVANVQEGVDNCGIYAVDRAQLLELQQLCQRVIDFKHLGTELLPTKRGFFFGGTDYDEWYYGALAHTVEVCNRALLLPPLWDFEYHASW